MKHFRFLILLLPGLLILTAPACHKDEPPDDTPPVFSVTPVDLSTVTSRIAFGADLTESQKNPAFEYYVNNSSVAVSSVCQGIVENIMLNDNFPDYEIWIKPAEESVWRIIYDHILNAEVSLDEEVNAGDRLGNVGVNNRTELQVNKISNNSELSYCPFDFGTDDFILQHKAYTEVWCLEDTVVP